MKTRLLGILVLTVLGFLVFVALASVGYAIAITFMVFEPWAIVVGTIIGMVLVLVQLWGTKK